MNRAKLCICGLLAAFAILAAGASAASATVQWSGSLTGPKMEVDVTGTTEPMVFKVGTLTVKCSGIKMFKAIVELSTLHSEAEALEFTGCKVEGSSKCELVESTIKTGPVKDELIENGSIIADAFEPKSGSTLVTIKLKKSESCAFPSSLAITGHATGTIDKTAKEAETEQKEHSLIFTTESGSSLKYEGEAVTLTGAAKGAIKEGGTYSA